MGGDGPGVRLSLSGPDRGSLSTGGGPLNVDNGSTRVRLRIHHPLFAGFLGVIGLLVVLITVFVGTGLRRELIEVQREELDRQLRLVESALVGMGDGSPGPLAQQLGDQLGHRVTLVSGDGIVLGDEERLKELGLT